MTSRRWIVAAAAFLAAPVLAGCSVGFDANTTKPYAPVEAAALINQGAYGKQSIHVPQAFILGPEPGGSIPWRGSVPVHLTMLNNGDSPDTLQSVSAGDAASAKLAAPVQLPVGQLVKAEAATPQITLEGLSKALRGGEALRLDLQFANAGTITLDVPVMPHSREYASYPAVEGAVPAPTPSPTPTEAAGEEAH
ncbi:copper chaperone PCu(A)C [Nonomuraea harbinensis]|uniref:Copper chaperone PCu(A)C n=1 Tax=Nonomuraea harbinensis TaxID=1286938 RepID=A0ABW1C475_9ACTN|nr:copper chaperone PCu(A)C [Nonomuraea harbinensis]